MPLTLKMMNLQQNPSMAAQLAQSQRIAGLQSPEQQAKLMQLKDDPELKDMFEDIQKNGAGNPFMALDSDSCILLQSISDWPFGLC